ncbi:MAG: LuxR C-terminal-related transcriptional regulator [Gammaproteobacteria bacterium]
MRVALVDGQQLFREGLSRLLSESKLIEVVASLKSGEEAVRFIHTGKADVFIIDAHLPGVSGLETSRRMLTANPDCAIVLMVNTAEDMVPSRLTKAGALGFITKWATTEEMLTAVQSVFAGRRYIGSDLAKAMALSMLHDDENSLLNLLSDREMQILIKVGQGQGNKQIASELHLSPKTVSTYRYRLYEKLNVRNDVDLAHIAIQYGLVKLKMLQPQP